MTKNMFLPKADDAQIVISKIGINIIYNYFKIQQDE